MSDSLRVVFDCNVFLQALANPDGPAGGCVELALTGKVALYISAQVLDEIRDVTARPKLIARFKLRPDRVAALLDNLPNAAVFVPAVPELWKYERDPDDAHYVCAFRQPHLQTIGVIRHHASHLEASHGWADREYPGRGLA